MLKYNIKKYYDSCVLILTGAGQKAKDSEMKVSSTPRMKE
jgi:hypothetical protein